MTGCFSFWAAFAHYYLISVMCHLDRASLKNLFWKKTNPCLLDFWKSMFALKESKNTFLCLRVNTAVFVCSITLGKGEFALNNKYRRMLRYVNDIIERLSSDFSQSPLNRKKTILGSFSLCWSYLFVRERATCLIALWLSCCFCDALLCNR